MKYLLTLILCLWSAAAWAVSPVFLGAATSGAAVGCDDGLLENGCFDDGATNWSKSYNSASITIGVVAGQMEVAISEFSYEGLKYDITLTNSASYTLTFNLIAIAGGVTPGVTVYVGDTDCGAITSTGLKTVTCNAGTSDNIKIVCAGAAPRSFTVDNVKLVAD